MNRGNKMLAVLADGREHSREEILALSPGGFYLTNNAASDLRARGYDVQFRVKDGLRLYQLVSGSLDASAVTVPSSPPKGAADASSEAIGRSGYVYLTPAFQERSPERARGVGAADAVAANGLEQLALTVAA